MKQFGKERRTLLGTGMALAAATLEPAIAHGAYAFRKEDGAFVDEFDKHLTAFIGTPEHIAIMERHGMSADELPKLETADLCGG